jgi:hypothetical protein
MDADDALLGIDWFRQGFGSMDVELSPPCSQFAPNLRGGWLVWPQLGPPKSGIGPFHILPRMLSIRFMCPRSTCSCFWRAQQISWLRSVQLGKQASGRGVRFGAIDGDHKCVLERAWRSMRGFRRWSAWSQEAHNVRSPCVKIFEAKFTLEMWSMGQKTGVNSMKTWFLVESYQDWSLVLEWSDAIGPNLICESNREKVLWENKGAIDCYRFSILSHEFHFGFIIYVSFSRRKSHLTDYRFWNHL